jgi:hypothetical protein
MTAPAPPLLDHPANRLALEHLKLLKLNHDPRTCPLLELAVGWLDAMERAGQEAFPSGDPAELLDRARLLTAEDQAWVTSLFVPDRERFQDQLDQNPEAWERLLREELDGLYQTLREAKTTRRAGQVAAENLYDSLRYVYPSFGGPSPSE